MKMAKELEEMGANSICIKDMAGLLLPYTAYDLVKAMKETVKIPIQLHTHYTSGVASMTYLKAIEAGVDVVDCAMSRNGDQPTGNRAVGRNAAGNAL